MASGNRKGAQNDGLHRRIDAPGKRASELRDDMRGLRGEMNRRFDEQRTWGPWSLGLLVVAGCTLLGSATRLFLFRGNCFCMALCFIVSSMKIS